MAESERPAGGYRVEVVYARPDEQLAVRLELPPGTRLAEAIRRSGLLERCPEIEFDRLAVGIYGRLASLDSELRDGDRVEIYRPLVANPKEMRRRNASAIGVKRRR
jgi:putative ubiquitin-RnfH superfamily antitoxin RatB of RatAB toxin-antitoxin module